jgi:hypothetical protein
MQNARKTKLLRVSTVRSKANPNDFKSLQHFIDDECKYFQRPLLKIYT